MKWVIHPSDFTIWPRKRLTEDDRLLDFAQPKLAARGPLRKQLVSSEQASPDERLVKDLGSYYERAVIMRVALFGGR